MIKQAVRLAVLVVGVWGIIWLEKNTGVPGMIIDGFLELVNTAKTNQ